MTVCIYLLCKRHTIGFRRKSLLPPRSIFLAPTARFCVYQTTVRAILSISRGLRRLISRIPEKANYNLYLECDVIFTWQNFRNSRVITPSLAFNNHFPCFGKLIQAAERAENHSARSANENALNAPPRACHKCDRRVVRSVHGVRWVVSGLAKIIALSFFIYYILYGLHTHSLSVRKS